MKIYIIRPIIVQGPKPRALPEEVEVDVELEISFPADSSWPRVQIEAHWIAPEES